MFGAGKTNSSNLCRKSARVLLRRINFLSCARIAVFRTSRSVFLCPDTLKRLANNAKSILDKSKGGGPSAVVVTPVIDSSSSDLICPRIPEMFAGLGFSLARASRLRLLTNRRPHLQIRELPDPASPRCKKY